MEAVLFSDHDHPNYWFSNYYPFKTSDTLSIIYDNKLWKTSEHLYQALKFECDTKEEKEWREIIRKSSTPNIAKYLGNLWSHCKYSWQIKYSNLVKEYRYKVRLIGDISDPKIRYNLMYTACVAKFENLFLKNKLLETGHNLIGENTNGYWGIYGENNLGEILMLIRSKLQK